MRLKTTPQLNYDNPASKTVSQWFFSNFTTTVTGKKWQWNAVTETYILPPTATFSTFSSAVGVYTLRAPGASETEKLEPGGRGNHS